MDRLHFYPDLARWDVIYITRGQESLYRLLLGLLSKEVADIVHTPLFYQYVKIYVLYQLYQSCHSIVLYPDCHTHLV